MAITQTLDQTNGRLLVALMNTGLEDRLRMWGWDHKQACICFRAQVIGSASDHAADSTWTSLFQHHHLHQRHAGYKFMLTKQQRQRGITNYGSAERLRAALSRAVHSECVRLHVIDTDPSGSTTEYRPDFVLQTSNSRPKSHPAIHACRDCKSHQLQTIKLPMCHSELCHN